MVLWSANLKNIGVCLPVLGAAANAYMCKPDRIYSTIRLYNERWSVTLLTFFDSQAIMFPNLLGIKNIMPIIR